jgi:hypothetical protein
MSTPTHSPRDYKKSAATPDGHTPWYRLQGLNSISHEDHHSGGSCLDHGTEDESAADIEKRERRNSLVRRLRLVGLSDDEILLKMAKDQAEHDRKSSEVRSAPHRFAQRGFSP